MYLFSYFRGQKDGLHLAYSYDGLKWTALNGNKSLLRPVVGKDSLMRDPSIVEGPDGTFHMVWTSSWTDRIIGYAPCEMHSIKGGMTNCQAEMKKAVECGYWNLFRFDPSKETGKFQLDSKAPKGGYQEFLMNEARYSRLTREFPERADVLFQRNEDEAKARYEHLLKLVEMYKD